MRIFLAIVLISVSAIHPANAAVDKTGPFILGFLGSTFVHESGHALATNYLGGEVLNFRPFPTKLRYLDNEGNVIRERWVAGVVRSAPFTGEYATQKQAWMTAMGSGTSFLSVFLLAPLMPEISSEFGRTSLDFMLFFAAMDWPAYVLTDLISGERTNDWSRVSELSGVSLYWYLAASLVAGTLANEYRYLWHKKAFPEAEDPDRLAVGFTVKY